MLDIIIISCGIIYSFIVIFITLGMFRLPKSFPVKDEDLPTVSIVVSARNEEHDLPKCIASLEQLNFPKEKLQVILVDDRSTDNTYSIIKKAAQQNEHFIALSTENAPENSLRAKARGISWGIEKSEQEWVFITDADAEVHPNWLRHMLSQVDEKTGIIGGMLNVKPVSFLAIIEQMSWAYALPVAFGLAGWGRSFVCVGPNMGIRRSVYTKYGGLQNADFNIAEDLALFGIIESAGFKSVSYLTQSTSIQLNPVSSYKHLFSQQRRWLRGGFEGPMSLRLGLVLGFGFHFSVSLLFIIGLFFTLEIALLALALKFLADLFMLISQKTLLRKNKILRYFPVQFLYILLVMIWLPASVLINPRISWEGDGYEINYK
ncbi:MAG: glycosyltransferase [Balneolaceae bacterium]